MSQPDTRSRTQIILLWFYVAVAWGGSYVAVNIGLSSLPPVFFAATRLDGGAIVALLLAWILSDDILPSDRKSVLDVVVTGVFIAAGTNIFLFTGEQYASSAAGAVIFGMNPVFAGLLSWILVPKERPDILGAIGLVVGIVGVGVVVGFHPTTLLAGQPEQYLLVFGAASLGLGSVLSRRLNASIEALPAMGWGLLLGGVLLHTISFALHEQIPTTSTTWTPSLWFAVAYLGIIATGIAYTAYYALLKDIEAIKVTLVSYLVPVVAAIEGFLILQEPINSSLVTGFVLITIGFALINKTSVKREILTPVNRYLTQDNPDDGVTQDD